MMKIVYLVVSASGDVRANTRPRVRQDEVAFRIKLHFPDGWGKVASPDIDLTVPDPPAVLADEIVDV